MNILSAIFLIQKAKKEKAFLGMENIKHNKGATLYHHGVRVQSILDRYGCDEIVQLAGMCHSVYTTEYFKEGIFRRDNRDVLTKKIGKESEALVYRFAQLDRETIFYNKENDTFSFFTYDTKEKVTVSYKEGVSLIHIMLANDVDHIEITYVGRVLFVFQKYKVFLPHLSDEAKKDLQKLIPLQDKKEEAAGGYIRFIAHAGVQIANESISVLVDPWIYDSMRESSLIEGFEPTQRTIDYLLPEPKNGACELTPDIICLSHFHTHHSPRREILEFAAQKPITIVCPVISEERLTMIKEKIGQHLFERITFYFVEKDTSIVISGVTIQVFVQQQDVMHVMYYLRLGDKSLLHIVDAKANMENHMSLDFADDWKRIYELKPTMLFIGAAGHSIKEIHNGRRVIHETASLTPVQAAKLASRIMPESAGVIGIYNHSVFDDRFEMTNSVGDIESHFYWALSFLAPAVKIKKLLPGDIVG